MLSALTAFLVLFAPFTSVRADADDGWTGEWVFTRSQDLPLHDEEGDIIGKWSVSAGKCHRSEAEPR